MRDFFDGFKIGLFAQIAGVIVYGIGFVIGVVISLILLAL
ncbi:hypothetical protein NitYY0918_C0301 [Nitratiruptor sp. YY09-18]|nr:hypothetical protein NitYY0918_C0301 [Nitratiruptor sp. YY09-18]